ncbi:MAG: UDP-glucose 4-epimerase [Candidatus Nealsonbacteria bacterium]|nr:MAG: UDP-glucose 4-epimerase [Candidatus Nealsonbacteria bacterium]
MKILVTGGAGFIGSHLTDKLIEQGHKVTVVDNLSTGKKENLNPKAKFYQLDIQSPEIAGVFEKEKPEIVFHFAAQIDVRKSVENPIESAKVNILGSLNLLENSRKYGVKKIIFASSGGAIYGETDVIPTPESYPENPQSPYGIEKLAIEKYLNFYRKTLGLNYIALRLANVYGPRQNSKGEAGVIAIFCDKMLKNKEVIINGDGEQTRDFVFVDDVVEAVLLAMEKEKSGIYNIGTAKETSINEIFRKIKELTNSNCQEIHGPEKPGEQKRSCLDYSRAKEELNWQPKYSLEEGLRETIEWFKVQS